MWTVFVICVLLLPCQFSSPTAAGSILRIPDIGMSSPPISLRDISVPGPGYPWDWYQMYASVRNTLVLRSAAYASIVNSETDLNQTSQMTWRGVPSIQGAPVNTTVSNITIPYFDIQGWEWVQDLGDLPSGIEESITGQGALNIASGNNPMQDAVEGNAALLKTDPWQPQMDHLLAAQQWRAFSIRDGPQLGTAAEA
jgi:hypothetical protein